MITHYMAHDPVSNTEAVLAEFNRELIDRAAAGGIVFIAVDADGSRSVVPADQVREPQGLDETLRIVQPAYVDDRMKAVVDVFDALAAAAPASRRKRSVRSADAEKPSFAEALEALRRLAYGEAGPEGLDRGGE